MNFLTSILTQFFEFIERGVQMIFSNPGTAYGVTIIVITVLIRILLLPLSFKQVRSQIKMQEVQPKLTKLQEKYKNDPAKAQQEMMKLYKEYDINPMSGCLPMLIQMPIFIALYSVFYNLQGLEGASFLWIKDLSQPDKFLILPVLSFVTQYASMKIASAGQSGPQAKQMSTMNLFMSGMIAIMSLKFKSALVLYWVANNLMSMAQTYLTKAFDPKLKNKPADQEVIETKVPLGSTRKVNPKQVNDAASNNDSKKKNKK